METPFDRHSYRVYAPHSSTNCGDSISISLDAVSSRDPRGIGNWFGFYVISMEFFFFWFIGLSWNSMRKFEGNFCNV